MMTIKNKLNLCLQHIFLFSTLTLISSTSIAGIYKWIDDEGNIHYGQQRPRDTNAQKMDVQQYAPQDTSTYKRPGSKTNDSQTGNTQASGSAKESKEPVKKKETKAEKKQRLAACEKTRKDLTTMESIGRIRSVDKDGNTKYLSQKEKEKRMGEKRGLLAKHCK